MTDALFARLQNTWRSHLHAAWSNGFPLVTGTIAESSPSNASPYVAALEEVFARLAGLPGRAYVRQPLMDLLHDLYEAGYVVDFMLAGGSFFDLENSSPKDFDALCLYRARPNVTQRANVLAGARARRLAKKMDLRFAAIEGELLIYLKALSYFSILYSQQKPTYKGAHRPGLLLIDTRPGAAGSDLPGYR